MVKKDKLLITSCVGCQKEFNYQQEFGVVLAIDNSRFDYYCATCRKNGTETKERKGCEHIGVYPKSSQK